MADLVVVGGGPAGVAATLAWDRVQAWASRASEAVAAGVRARLSYAQVTVEQRVATVGPGGVDGYQGVPTVVAAGARSVAPAGTLTWPGSCSSRWRSAGWPSWPTPPTPPPRRRPCRPTRASPTCRAWRSTRPAGRPCRGCGRPAT